MKKTIVINLVGLSGRLLADNSMPFLNSWASKKKITTIEPVMPAVTCSAQSTYLTGKWPSEHGVVGNGWYFRDECEVKLWRQSNKLVEAPKIWEVARTKNQEFTCANMFWWYNMYSTVDYSVTPRPQYLADGRKIPDCYSYPADIRDKLQKDLGTFPLFNFWGPKASIKSSIWIAEASKKVHDWYDPTLMLIYLPHLDYGLQKFGTTHASLKRDFKNIDALCKDLIRFFEKKKVNVLVLSEYGITDVNHPVHINRVLRNAGYLNVRIERNTELLDAGASTAFALADHQIAHVYVNDKDKIVHIKKLLEATEGIEMVLDETTKQDHHLDHPRSGELVAIADKNSWFTYYYWMEDHKAPDFARLVDIHRKPGYDPVEMYLDPEQKYIMPKIMYKLAKKKIGFRTLMDVIPLDASLVKGSHGRTDVPEGYKPVFIGNANSTKIMADKVFDEIMNAIFAH